MAKLIKTDPKNLINLQSGTYAHFVEDGIAINDVKTYEPRHRVSRINESRNVRGIRLVLNVVLSLTIISVAFLSGFYPLSLLLFLMLFDLRAVQRINLPINLSDFIPFENIVKIKMIKGRLGFNYAHIIIKDDNGKSSLKKLNLYDSDSTWQRATDLFQSTGKLQLEKDTKKDISKLERITVGQGIEYGIEGDQLLLIENNKFNEEREDPYKYSRAVLVIGFAVAICAAGAKLKNMITLYDYAVVDYMVVAFFLLVSIVPLKLIGRTNPTRLDKSDIIGVERKKKYLIIKLKRRKGFPFYVRFYSKYVSDNDLNKLNTFYKG